MFQSIQSEGDVSVQAPNPRLTAIPPPANLITGGGSFIWRISGWGAKGTFLFSPPFTFCSFVTIQCPCCMQVRWPLFYNVSHAKHL